MSETVRIDGLAQLEKNLRDLTPAIQGRKGFPKNVLRNAARAMATDVKNTAKAKVPVDTGRLQRAIVAKLLSAKYRDRAILQGDSKELYYVGIKRGKDRKDPNGAYYGSFVETGTDKMPARPFLRPALEERKSALPGIFKEKLGRDLDNIARKLGQR